MSRRLMPPVITMSSMTIVDVINEERKAEAAGEPYAVLRHDNFIAKIESHPGIDAPKFLGTQKYGNGNTRKVYNLPKREAELMVMSESLAVQARVYDRLALLESSTVQKQVAVDPAMSAFRTARAIASNTKTAATLCALFPALGDAAKQTIYAKLVNAAAREEIVPLPVIEKMIGATEVGKIYGISKNAVGKLANGNGLKIPQYGEFMMDKSASSEKQMPSFRYNSAGVARIGELLGEVACTTQGRLELELSH